MPPLLCPSPVLLDQSFPRSQRQLDLVASALGEIQKGLEAGEFDIIKTATFADFLIDFAWKSDRQGALLLVYNLLSQWYLQPHSGVVQLDCEGAEAYEPHPIPLSAGSDGLCDLWADEIGRLLVVHDSCCDQGHFFIGVACESAFGGGELGSYADIGGRRAFPLVGPPHIGDLEDAYRWDMPIETDRVQVSFRDILANYRVIGGSRVETPSRGSHYKVHFPAQRSWPLDRNVDPIPDRFLRQLVPLTGLPLGVIRYALSQGELPQRVIRIAH